MSSTDLQLTKGSEEDTEIEQNSSKSVTVTIQWL